MKPLSLELFRAATGAPKDCAELYYEPVLECMDRFKISEQEQRVAAFLATIGIESGRLTMVQESLYYRDAARLASIYPRKFKSAADAEPYVKNHYALSQLLYNGFHGRGLIQLTWEQNYRIHGRKLGFDYVAKPDLLLEPWHAAMSAGSFWDLNGCNAVSHCITTVTERVNGPRKMHLEARTAQYDENLLILA